MSAPEREANQVWEDFFFPATIPRQKETHTPAFVIEHCGWTYFFLFSLSVTSQKLSLFLPHTHSPYIYRSFLLYFACYIFVTVFVCCFSPTMSKGSTVLASRTFSYTKRKIAIGGPVTNPLSLKWLERCALIIFLSIFGVLLVLQVAMCTTVTLR